VGEDIKHSVLIVDTVPDFEEFLKEGEKSWR
jgi:hypothetical protein